MLRLCFERAVIDTAEYTDAVTAFIRLSINRSSVGCDYTEKKTSELVVRTSGVSTGL